MLLKEHVSRGYKHLVEVFQDVITVVSVISMAMQGEMPYVILALA